MRLCLLWVPMIKTTVSAIFTYKDPTHEDVVVLSLTKMSRALSFILHIMGRHDPWCGLKLSLFLGV